MARFSATASMTQSQPASLGRSSSKLPGVMQAAQARVIKGRRFGFGQGFEAGGGELVAVVGCAFGDDVEEENGDAGSWPGGRRCGSPWCRRRERRRGVPARVRMACLSKKESQEGLTLRVRRTCSLSLRIERECLGDTRRAYEQARGWVKEAVAASMPRFSAGRRHLAAGAVGGMAVEQAAFLVRALDGGSDVERHGWEGWGRDRPVGSADAVLPSRIRLVASSRGVSLEECKRVRAEMTRVPEARDNARCATREGTPAASKLRGRPLPKRARSPEQANEPAMHASTIELYVRQGSARMRVVRRGGNLRWGRFLEKEIRHPKIQCRTGIKENV